MLPISMLRFCIPMAALAAALGLAGCNETVGGATASPVAEAPAPPVAMSLPQGAACSNEINKFQAILRDDLQTGNVAQSVYDQIQSDLTRASSACSAGKGKEAHAIIAASKSRHGYRA